MKTEITKEPIYKTEKIKIGENDKTIYVAEDGKKFANKKECENYEKNLQTIRDAEKFITEIRIDDEQNNISELIFGGYDVSSAQFFKWVATKDKKIIEQVREYLNINNCSVHQNELEKFEEGDKVLISSWAEGESGDYPRYETKAIKYDDAIKIIDDLSNKMKSVFK